MSRGIRAGVALVVTLAVACGGTAPEVGGAATTTNPAPETAATAPTPQPAEAPSTSTSVVRLPAIAAVTSGRGDDGSLEVGIWFTSDPFAAGDARVLVGADTDESFPGVGDPVGHLDGWVEITSGGVALFDDGAVVADDALGNLSEWLSWTGPGPVVWVYFFGNVPPRAGTIWVVLEVDGEIVAGGAAGAPFDTGCSYRSAGVDLGPVSGDVPDPGAPCRYPLG
ncbi:MAG: hypothetical protein V3V29_08655 [Acidimicrobiia bacterium]